MLKLRIKVIFAGVAATVIAAFFVIKSDPDKAYVAQAYNYGQENVTRFLSKRGIKVNAVSSLARNAAGTELFVFLFPDETGQNKVAKITAEGLKVVTCPSQKAFIGPDGDFVAWFSEQGDKVVNFKDGQTLALGTFALFDIDPRGTYFVLSEGPDNTWIGRVESPQHRVKISKGFVGSRIFSKGQTVYVSGHFQARHASSQVASCLVLRETGEDFKIVSQHDFDWSFGVEDIARIRTGFCSARNRIYFRRSLFMILVRERNNRLADGRFFNCS